MAVPSTYQRVGNVAVTPSDYDASAGFYYLKFDGVDDSLSFSPAGSVAITDDALFVVGAFLQSGQDMLFAAQTSPGTNNAYEVRVGSFGAAAEIQFVQANASAVQTISFATTPAPRDAGAVIRLYRAAGQVGYKVNQSALLSFATTLTPTVGPTPVFSLGKRPDGYGPLNGRIYSLVIRGGASTADQITQTEQWVNGKTGAY